MLIILSNRNAFYQSFLFIKKISQGFLDDLDINEQKYINFLRHFLENCQTKECDFINKNLDLINWVHEEELLEHERDYNLILLPFERNETLNVTFVKFLITSNIKEDAVAAFGFTNTGTDFYIDIAGNEYFDIKINKKVVLIERKIKDWDKDYEIKSKAFMVDQINNFYLHDVDFDNIDMPNFSFLASMYQHEVSSYLIGYDLNDIKDLYFANFFYDLSKKKVKEYSIIKEDFGEIIHFK